MKLFIENATNQQIEHGYFTNASSFIVDGLQSIVIQTNGDKEQPTLAAIMHIFGATANLHPKSDIYIFLDSAASDIELKDELISRTLAWQLKVIQILVIIFLMIFSLDAFYSYKCTRFRIGHM